MFYLLLILIIVLSMDAFTAGLSYGMDDVRVPFSSVLTVAFLSGCMLTLSLYAGDFLLLFLPAGLTKIVSFTVLFLLSLYKLYDTIPWLHKGNSGLTTDKISQKINYASPSILSKKEAALLGMALSVDNISAGLCTGTLNINPCLLLLITTLIHLLSIRLGLFTGKLLSQKGLRSFSWLGAAILMLLAFCRLL
ncbi:MAG: hypothetical protein HDR20_06415 [Lachnospiraceae bacterium]|nr:hypothetical protein [Lachnospiraceae bacterium]